MLKNGLESSLRKVFLMIFSTRLLVPVAAPYCSDVPLSLPESSNAARPHLTCTNKSRAVAGLLPVVDNHEAHTLCL